MTTLTLTGIQIDYFDRDPVSVGTVETVLVMPSKKSSFTYTIDYYDEGVPIVEINENLQQITFNGQFLDDNSNDEAILTKVTWSGGTTTVLGVAIETGNESDTDFFFVLDGAPLPTINTVADWNNFDDSITAIGAATDPFAPGQSIRWTELDGHSLTEDDELYGTNGKDVLSGGKGDDYFVSSKGADTYKGGKGYDQVAFHINDPAGVTANLGTGTATDGWGNTDKLVSIEMLRGSLYDDTLIGDGGDNIIRGLAGDDVLNGANGRDEVRYDRDANYGGDAGVTVNLKKGNATDGFGDSDTLRNFEDVRGSDNADRITGDNGKNELEGEGGNDKLFGLGGRDTLWGGKGKDQLDGGNGNDDLYGDGGNDKFIFDGRKFGDDTIHDFQTRGKGEKIDLSGVNTIKSFKDLKNNHISEVNGDALIEDGIGNSIRLVDVSVSDLSANDFLF